MAEEQNKSIPKVELSNFTFSPPGPMGWSFQEYEELLQDPNQFLDSHSKFTNLLAELETAKIIELPTTSRDFVPVTMESVSDLESMGEVDSVTPETAEQELPVSTIKEGLAETITEPTTPVEAEPSLEEEAVQPVLTSEMEEAVEPVVASETGEEMEEAAELVVASETGEEIEEADQPVPANEAVEEAPQPVSQGEEDEWFVLTGGKTKKGVKKRRTRGNNVIFA